MPFVPPSIASNSQSTSPPEQRRAFTSPPDASETRTPCCIVHSQCIQCTTTVRRSLEPQGDVNTVRDTFGSGSFSRSLARCWRTWDRMPRVDLSLGTSPDLNTVLQSSDHSRASFQPPSHRLCRACARTHQRSRDNSRLPVTAHRSTLNPRPRPSSPSSHPFLASSRRPLSIALFPRAATALPRSSTCPRYSITSCSNRATSQ